MSKQVKTFNGVPLPTKKGVYVAVSGYNAGYLYLEIKTTKGDRIWCKDLLSGLTHNWTNLDIEKWHRIEPEKLAYQGYVSTTPPSEGQET